MSDVGLLDRNDLARRIARDIPDGAIVNLGVGIPTLVSNHLPEDREILLHSENGLIGMGAAPGKGNEDYDLVNAGKQPVTLLNGAAIIHQADSFALMRGGHLDIAVLGAFQVSASGDLANWHTGDPTAIPAVGGAMDLAVGARETWVAMNLFTSNGESKIVKVCTYPLTGKSCVTRIYTDYGTFAPTARGLVALDLVPGVTVDILEARLGMPVLPN